MNNRTTKAIDPARINFPLPPGLMYRSPPRNRRSSHIVSRPFTHPDVRAIAPLNPCRINSALNFVTTLPLTTWTVRVSQCVSAEHYMSRSSRSKTRSFRRKPVKTKTVPALLKCVQPHVCIGKSRRLIIAARKEAPMKNSRRSFLQPPDLSDARQIFNAVPNKKTPTSGRCFLFRCPGPVKRGISTPPSLASTGPA